MGTLKCVCSYLSRDIMANKIERTLLRVLIRFWKEKTKRKRSCFNFTLNSILNSHTKLVSLFHNLERICFNNMDNINTDSPLSTKAKRDKFVRQPLSVLGAETPKPRTRKKDVHNDPEETITPTSVPSSSNILKDVTDNRRPTRRSPRSIINYRYYARAQGSPLIWPFGSSLWHNPP